MMVMRRQPLPILGQGFPDGFKVNRKTRQVCERDVPGAGRNALNSRQIVTVDLQRFPKMETGANWPPFLLPRERSAAALHNLYHRIVSRLASCRFSVRRAAA